jgi:hypothetical protein
MAEKTQTFEEILQDHSPLEGVADEPGSAGCSCSEPLAEYTYSGWCRHVSEKLHAEVAALEERIRQLEARISLALLKAEDMHDSDDWLDAGELIDLLRAAAGKKGT